MGTPIGDLSRRQFLQRAGAAALAAGACPALIPAAALGQGAAAPSARLRLGAIGVGEQGSGDMGAALAQADVRVMAVCDVKQSAREAARQRVNERYQNQDCVAYADFRELLARPDLDGVIIATPDHWHVFAAVAACQAGKDVYLEKPMGLSLAEDQALRRAVNQHGRVFQFGTQQRSSGQFRRACELVRSGLIGKLQHIDVWCIGSAVGGPTSEVPIPPDINYDFWVGPAQYQPYTELRTHANWLKKTWWFEHEYALGFIAGWGVHPLDIAYWGAGDLARCNVEVAGRGEIPTQGACNTAIDWKVDFAYASGLTLSYQASRLIGINGGPSTVPAEFKKKYGARGSVVDHGTAFVGDRGWVHVHRGGIWTEPESLVETKPDSQYVSLYQSNGHMRNFLDCMRSRKPTICPVDEAVQTDLLCHLSDQAIRRGRKLAWDFSAEKFLDDDEANRLMGARPIRPPWKLG